MALPDGTHLLHIGPQKTGSTAIQSALHRARAQLLTHGVMYPGPSMRPAEAAGAGLGFATPTGGPQASIEAWHDLLRQVHEPGHRLVCVSHEAFGRAEAAQAAQVVETLGGDRPHVVAVARRYDRLMPSQWQQRVKAKLRLSYAEWLEVVLGEPAPEDPVWRNLWVPHDTAALAERWSSLVGRENFTLIVADDRDRELLPRTFESLLGVPEGLLDLTGGRRNRSLTYSEVEVLRGLNIGFHDRGWSAQDYYELVHRGVIPALVRSEKSPEEPEIPPLPAWALERLVELSDRRIKDLGTLGVNVVGGLEKLRIDPAAVPTGSADAEVSVSLQTALKALDGLAARAVATRKQDRRRLRKLRRRATAGTGAAARRARRLPGLRRPKRGR